MSQVERTGQKQTAQISSPISADTAKKISEFKDAIKKINDLMREPNSLLWKVDREGLQLSYGTCNPIMEAGGPARKLKPKEEKNIKDLRRTVLALDNALTLLGFQRDIITQLGVPESEQADFSWISKRFVRFQKKRGLMAMESMQSQAVIGKKSIDELLKALNE